MANPAIQQALNFFINKGYEQHQAVGIVANLMQESNLDPKGTGDYVKGSATSFGIAQWHNERFQALKSFADDQGTSWNDFNTQLEFVDHELHTTEKVALQKLTAATNEKEATAAFLHFERPAAFDPNDPYNNPEFAKRSAIAADISGVIGPSTNPPVAGQPPSKTVSTAAPEFGPIKDQKLVDVLKVPPPIPYGKTQFAQDLTVDDIFSPPVQGIELPPIPDPIPIAHNPDAIFMLPRVQTGAMQRLAMMSANSNTAAGRAMQKDIKTFKPNDLDRLRAKYPGMTDAEFKGIVDAFAESAGSANDNRR